MGLEGKLIDLPMIDLLRIFQRSARSGKLMIWRKTEWALIWLVEGQAVNAVVLNKADRRPLHVGAKALLDLFTWTEGQFRYNYEPASSNYPVAIRQPTGELIGEALQRQRIAPLSQFVDELSLHTCLSVLPHMMGLNERVQLRIDEWAVLIRIGQQTTIQQIVTESRLPMAQVQRIVAYLISCGLVMRLRLGDLPQRRHRLVQSEALASHTIEHALMTTNLMQAIRRRLQQIAAPV
jgi:hypothetical protein